ncbi:MAG: SAM-dependent methyltransferase [Chthoniobacterales bacterium]
MSAAAFLGELDRSLETGKFHRLTLARPANGEVRKNVLLRPANIRGESMIQLTHRHPTRDEVENLTPVESHRIVAGLLGKNFLDAHLETDDSAISLRFSRKGAPHLSRKKLQTNNLISAGHDRQKTRLLNPMQLPWLADLGLADVQGNILPSRSAKWRQVERFVELISHAWRDVSWSGERPLEIFDMGCGKGYLTFAIEAWFTDNNGTPVLVHGVEQRPELVELCNGLAQKHQRPNLRFELGRIGDATFTNLDVLIALHACDTATDDALALGIRHEAQMIVCAPCCQHEFREKMQGSSSVIGLLEHGLFRQRQAALLTDTLRTLILEREGYSVRVVEFVSSEHTDKNLLLIATRTGKKSPNAQLKLDQLKTLFGLPTLHLETLLT